MSMSERHQLAAGRSLSRRAFTRVAFGAAGAGILTLAGCGDKSSRSQSGDANSIRVGASPSPHAIILQHVASALERDGYHLDIIEYESYFRPNDDLASGKLDANYFQHQPFLDDYNMSYNATLASAGKVHFEPMCVFGAAGITLDTVPQGSDVTVPSDPTNYARALQLVASTGLIRLADGAGLKASLSDVVDNPKQLNIIETDASLVPGTLGSSALVVVNGNYAISSKLQIDDALAREAANSDAAKSYANIVAVREGETESAKTSALMKALTSDDAREFMRETFKGTVEPAV